LEFNKEGTHLAYGNSDGILSILELGQSKSDNGYSTHVCSKPYQSFLSHEPEFDCLKSQSIEEKLTFIRWLNRCGPSHFLLSANERTIKLWRVTEVAPREMTNMNFPTESGSRRKVVIRSNSDLKVPLWTVQSENKVVRVYNKKVFARGHGFSLTGLSTFSDQETFLSSDPLRINLWHYDIDSEAFSILFQRSCCGRFCSLTLVVIAVVDLMPERIEDITHLITSLTTSPKTPALFAYGTNRGSIRVCDLRAAARCDQPAISVDNLPSTEQNMILILLNSIADVKFLNNSDRHLVSRDFMSVKVWDLAMPSIPVEVYAVQSHLRPYLNSICETELLFDDFKLSLSSDDRYIFTGSYQDEVRIIDRSLSGAGTYKLKMECDDSPFYSNFYNQSDLGASSPDSAPWPRPLTSELIQAPEDEIEGNFPITSLFSPTNVKKWISVSWCPNSLVAATCHADAIHIIEGVEREAHIPVSRQSLEDRRWERAHEAGAAGAAPGCTSTPGSDPTECECHKGHIMKEPLHPDSQSANLPLHTKHTLG
uniref:Serine/threonine-protein phosphatase 2A 55 kDa regulatory subunit B n=1 Tax=Schistocephalus solidus TaxID=70667 RepID=A0A183S9U9_SCHSO